MNFLKSAALSLVMLFSLASAKVSLEAAIVDNGNLTTIPEMILELNQPEVKYVDDVRFEAILVESNSIVFDLSFKDESGEFVSYVRPQLVLTETDEKAVLETTNKNGNPLVLLVHTNNIQE